MFKKAFVILLLLVIIVIGNRLRSYSYSQVPLPGETRDEYSFAWVGLSLIENHFPIAWSGISAYPKHDFERINVDGIFNGHPEAPLFSIDRPWFDHPPLFGLITGGYAYLKGVRNFADASVIIIRRPMLKIALLNTILIFILCIILFDKNVGLLASAMYSIVPTTVITSRLALAENGYIPMMLAALILASTYFKRKKEKFWIWATVVSSIALWFKLSAVFVPMTLALTAFVYGAKKRNWLLMILLISTAVSILFYLAYGAYFGWDTFARVFQANSNRFYGSSSEVFFSAIVQGRITATKFVTDGWLVLSWICFFIFTFIGWKKDMGVTVVSSAVFSYALVFILFGSEPYGWYRFPFYPLLLISASKILIDIYKQNRVFFFYLLILLPFGTSLHRLVGSEGFQTYVSLFRFVNIFVFLTFFFGIVTGSAKISKTYKILMISMLFFVFWLSIKEVYFYDIDKWYFAT